MGTGADQLWSRGPGQGINFRAADQAIGILANRRSGHRNLGESTSADQAIRNQGQINFATADHFCNSHFAIVRTTRDCVYVWQIVPSEKV